MAIAILHHPPVGGRYRAVQDVNQAEAQPWVQAVDQSAGEQRHVSVGGDKGDASRP